MFLISPDKLSFFLNFIDGKCKILRYRIDVFSCFFVNRFYTCIYQLEVFDPSSSRVVFFKLFEDLDNYFSVLSDFLVNFKNDNYVVLDYDSVLKMYKVFFTESCLKFFTPTLLKYFML